MEHLRQQNSEQLVVTFAMMPRQEKEKIATLAQQGDEAALDILKRWANGRIDGVVAAYQKGIKRIDPSVGEELFFASQFFKEFDLELSKKILDVADLVK